MWLGLSRNIRTTTYTCWISYCTFKYPRCSIGWLRNQMQYTCSFPSRLLTITINRNVTFYLTNVFFRWCLITELMIRTWRYRRESNRNVIALPIGFTSDKWAYLQNYSITTAVCLLHSCGSPPSPPHSIPYNCANLLLYYLPQLATLRRPAHGSWSQPCKSVSWIKLFLRWWHGGELLKAWKN